MSLNLIRRNPISSKEKVVNVVESEKEASDWLAKLEGKLFAEDGYWMIDGDYFYLMERKSA